MSMDTVIRRTERPSPFSAPYNYRTGQERCFTIYVHETPEMIRKGLEALSVKFSQIGRTRARRRSTQLPRRRGDLQLM